MYTTVDKAIVTAVMAAVQLANVLGFHFGLDPNVVGGTVALLMPILVYLWPNLPKDAT